ncbi:MAG: hypothetical protein LUP97_04450 [Methanoregula sp.]|nr:hypothetical protein [Methanoregula sp.]
MVDPDAQLYTIEGISAGLIMLLTAYIIVNSTSIYTPGDTHISDMQLEVTGSDALTMLNTAPNNSVGLSPLRNYVGQNDGPAFTTAFLNLVNNRTGGMTDTIQFVATVSYVRPDNAINSTPFAHSSRPLTGGEHAVHVTKWVIVKNKIPESPIQRNRAELVEVLLWRD